MAYTNATFFLDQEGGSDTARANLVPTAYANNGSGLVRVTCNSTAAYANNAVMDVAGTTGAVYDGAWKVTIVSGTTVDLLGSTFTVNPAAKGSLTPRGGSQKSDAWKTITSGATSGRTAAGDTIRVMGSPDPVSLGVNGTWTKGTQAQWIAQNIASSTNATPIVVTLSGANWTALNPSVGDTVLITGHTTNTKANGVWKISATNGSTTVTLQNADGTNSVGNGIGGASGTIRKINKCVVALASNQSVNIACIGNQGTKAWTNDAGANATIGVSTSDFKEGGESVSIAVLAGFATGLVAHFDTGTLDLSGQTKVSFWVKQTAGTVAVAGDAKLQLCTAIGGITGVHDLAIPALASLNRWVPVVFDNGGALNSAIKSINFTQVVDRGAQTFLIDCVYAGNLTLRSLIGKNNGVNGETFSAIQSVNNVRVMLDRDTNTLPNSTYGYYGTNETVAVYYRETIPTAIAASGNTQISVPQRSGSSGSPITFSGGWDRTNMTTQNLETWFDGLNGQGYGFLFSGVTYVNLDKINVVRYDTGFYFGNTGTASFCSVGNSVHANNCTTASILATSSSAGTSVNNISGAIQSCSHSGAGIQIQGASVTANISTVVFDPVYALNSCPAPISMNSAHAASYCRIGGPTTEISASNGSTCVWGVATCFNYIGKLVVDASNADAIKFGNTGGGASFNTFASITATNSAGFGFLAFSGSIGNTILGGSTSGNASGSYSPSIGTTAQPSSTYFRNFTFGEGAPSTPTLDYVGQAVYVTDYGGSTDDNRQYLVGGTIKSQTTTRHTASGVAWQFSPTSANRSATYPLEMPLAQIAVAANKLVTVKCWIYRDNTATLVAKMLCKGGQIAGVTSDVSVTASGAINTWQEETITFTPTEAGVIEIVAQVYGGTTLNAYYDDMTISQAA